MLNDWYNILMGYLYVQEMLQHLNENKIIFYIKYDIQQAPYFVQVYILIKKNFADLENAKDLKRFCKVLMCK